VAAKKKLTKMADRVTNETESFIKSIETAIPKSTLYWFFISLASAIIWTIYLAYYNSRVIGLIATLFLNKFSKFGRINIGKLEKIVFFYLLNL
jgi:hypothetical protein